MVHVCSCACCTAVGSWQAVLQPRLEACSQLAYLLFDGQGLPKTLFQGTVSKPELVHGKSGTAVAGRPAVVLLVVPGGPAYDCLLHGDGCKHYK